MRKSQFVLLAGEPILDFVNTHIQHSHAETEFLSDSDQAQAFFKTVFASKLAIKNSSLLQLKKIRTNLRQYFLEIIQKSSKSRGRPQRPTDVDQSGLRYVVEVSQSHPQDRFRMSVLRTSNSAPINIVTQKLFDFLMMAQPSRIKKCKSKTCSHLFYDKSKSNSRVWCSMKSCGNLAKIRKYRSVK